MKLEPRAEREELETRPAGKNERLETQPEEQQEGLETRPAGKNERLETQPEKKQEGLETKPAGKEFGVGSMATVAHSCSHGTKKTKLSENFCEKYLRGLQLRLHQMGGLR